MSAPHLLDSAKLQSFSKNRKHVGRTVQVIDQTASTNDICHAADESNGSPGLVVFAEVQSAGRGQRGRVWHAPKGTCLLFSMLLDNERPGIEAFEFVAWSAVSICETLQREFGLQARIRWPNDILIDGKKIAGILVERRRRAVVGIGLNVNLRDDQLPTDCRIPPTSMQNELGREIDRTMLAEELLNHLDDHYTRDIASADVGKLLADWRRFSLFQPGDRVVVMTNQTAIAGQLQSLDPRSGVRILDAKGVISAIRPEDIASIESAERFR